MTGIGKGWDLRLLGGNDGCDSPNAHFCWPRIVSRYFQPFFSRIVVPSPSNTQLSAMISLLPSSCFSMFLAFIFGIGQRLSYASSRPEIQQGLLLCDFPLYEASNLTGSTNQGCLAKLAAAWSSFGNYDRTTFNRLENCFAPAEEIFGEGFSPFHISLSACISAQVRGNLSTHELVTTVCGYQKRFGSDLMWGRIWA